MPPKKILAMKLRALGDTVLMTAPLLELKKAYPEAKIDLAVLSSWAPILDHHPAVSRIFTYEKHADKAARAKSAARLGLTLRKERYDVVVNFHASPSSSMIAFATGAKVRSVHFHGHQHKNTYSTVEIPGKGQIKPIIERDMDTIRALGLHIPAGRLPELFLQPSEVERAHTSLREMGFSGPLLGIGLGASRPTKTWPFERFAQLSVEWIKATGGSVLAVAGPKEKAHVLTYLTAVDDAITALEPDPGKRSQLRSRITASHDLSLRHLAALQSRMSVFVGNDSGPKHIAIAVETPTVTLFGPEHPFEWHPYPQDRHPYFFVDNLACRKDGQPGMPPWCGLHDCVIEGHKCMKSIGTKEVLDACLRVKKNA